MATIPFSVGKLITEYHLSDHYDFIRNIIDGALGEKADFVVHAPHDVQMTAYNNGNKVLVHFVNEVGQRPLLDNIPVRSLSFSMKVAGGNTVKNVVSVIEETEVTWEMADGRVNVRIPQLTVWDMIQIEME